MLLYAFDASYQKGIYSEDTDEIAFRQFTKISNMEHRKY